MSLVRTFSERNGFTVSQKGFLSVTHLSFRFLYVFFVFFRSDRQYFLCFVHKSLFVPFRFLRQLFPSLDLLIVALESSLVEKGIWLLWTYSARVYSMFPTIYYRVFGSYLYHLRDLLSTGYVTSFSNFFFRSVYMTYI